ncbi:MAG TPA: hypothetical protein VFH68_16860 [Polyangia bacterium]|nr:hypothetical protein [Polyangia bacterium]
MACVSLLGCADDLANAPAAVQFDACQPLVLAPDLDAGPEQLQGISDAVDLWNSSAATRLSMQVHDRAASGGAAGSSLPIHFQQAAAPFHGFYDDRDIQIFINRDLADHARIVAISHELGHAFGLVHVAPAERPSVMNSGNITIDPTADDVGALATRWGHCAPASP